jgi:hypothetical protein
MEIRLAGQVAVVELLMTQDPLQEMVVSVVVAVQENVVAVLFQVQ